MKKNASFLIKKQRDPKIVKFWAVTSCVLLIAFAFALYLFGQWRAGYLTTNFEVTFKELNNKIDQLEEDRNKFLNKSADIESALKIEQEVVGNLKTRLKELDNENSELKEELAFYTSLLDPSQQHPGLHIQQLEVYTHQFTGALLYRLVLAQVRGEDRFVSGDFIIEIKGTEDGKVTTLQMDKVLASKASKESFRFKYFQTIEGELNLPVNFVPTDVRVRIKSKTRKIESIQKVYAWTAIKS